MSTIPFVPGLAHVIVKGSLVSTRWANVFHVLKANAQPWGDNELISLASGLRSAYVTNFGPVMVAASFIGDVTATDLGSDTGGTATQSGNTPGTGAGASLPANVATGVSWKINRRYRGGHPRTYLPGVPVGAISDPNTFTGTHVTAVGNGANAFRTAIAAISVAGTSCSLVCVGYRRQGVLLPVPLISQIQSGSCDTRPDSQRRRLGRDR